MPERCSFMFTRIRLHPAIPDKYEPKHLLWTLYFLLTYATERRLCCILRADRKTIRKYTWPTITAISSLAQRYIRWENRLLGDSGRAAKVTVDGTDFETVEYVPFNPARRSHKLNRPGLRYEVAISIATCYIVHINGPFLCGEWPDLRIARRWLHSRLGQNEYYLADSGYRCGNGPAITRNALPPHRRPTFDGLMARHETINRRFKEFAILGNKYRHEEEKHGEIFRCIAVLIQIDLSHGNLGFQVA